MFNRNSAETIQEKLDREADERDRKDLELLRKEKAERLEVEAKKIAHRAAEKYRTRTWVPEGSKTGVESLVIDGGKLWRIGGEIYFQSITTSSNYYGGLSGLAAQANAYNVGCYTATSAGSLQRL